jgi:mannose-6-phosphate isomerase-like protein (cupin superfamily)
VGFDDQAQEVTTMSADPSTPSSAAPQARAGAPFSWPRAGLVYARIALGAAFLSAVASRFGIWKGHPGVASSLYLLTAPPGRGPKLHRHEYDEVIVVLEGAGTVYIGDQQRGIAAGDIVAVPARTPHRFVNTGDTPLRQVDVHASPEFRQENLEPATP